MTTELRNCRETLLVDDSDLSESRFSDTRLEKSSFHDVNLRGTAFSDADLSNASFVNVNLAGVSIENAKLDGMKIDGVLVSALMEAYRKSGDGVSQRPTPSAVLFVKDLARVARFYETIASMSVIHADQEHMVLEFENFQLVLHAVPKGIGDAIEITEPPKIRTNLPIKLCFPVARIPDARRSALALGGMLNPSAQEWIDRGSRICDGYDPEGNVIQVRSNVA
jgi:predicted enzyme related to lactoylglutathione lyase